VGIADAGLADLARRHVPALRRNLRHVIDFWYPATLDRAHGGFALNHDINGRFRGPGPKATVTQARMVWLSARLARFGHEPVAMLAAAEHGHRFLMERLWDGAHGGFVWDADVAGIPARRNRHLYGQAFGLYALSEYAMASGRAEVLGEATALFELLEDKAKDREHPGYLEAFAPDWNPLPENEGPYLGPRGSKLLNTHLHLLEALTTHARVSGSGLARERVGELIAVIADKVIDPMTGGCTDVFARDWTRLGGRHAVVSYGHDVETIWLLADACEVAGVSPGPLVERFVRTFEYALANGYDAVDGGLYDRGPLGEPATHRGKIWWVQAEAIVSALWMHRLTGDRHYLEVFEQTWGWIEARQTDWREGEWYAVIEPGYRAMGGKADVWKEGYHNGRALMECLAILEPALTTS
jgi:mannobiose 2-epimerase